MSKSEIQQFWEEGPPGQRYGDSEELKQYFKQISKERYKREPYIDKFADFREHSNDKVLEIGIGDGSDFQRWIECGADVTGIDFSSEAIKLARKRTETFGLNDKDFNIMQSDAERLPFKSDTFDVVYSWGVLHHTSDTRKALTESFRILKKGGTLKMMVYGLPSWVGLMLQIRYGIMRGRLLYTQKEALWNNLESMGTEGFTDEKLENMVENAGFKNCNIDRELSPGDLLNIRFSEDYQSNVYKIVRFIYPTSIIRKFGEKYGLYQLVTATKG